MLGAVVLGLLCTWGAGCSRDTEALVLYAAQDRVFVDPILAEFTRQTGIRVRVLYDNEATKTVGLVNRLRAEKGRPLADVWWSNEELQTRRLILEQVLEPDLKVFGARQRVLVCHTNEMPRWQSLTSLAVLTNRAFDGQFIVAYPLAGSTLNHFAALRLRWGENAWTQWLGGLLANRPILVDGNSAVVRWMGRKEGFVGLTDSDDVRFACREGAPLAAIPLPPGDGLTIPNSVAIVANGRHRAAALRFIEFMSRPEVQRRLRDDGALDPQESAPVGPQDSVEDWEQLIREFHLAAAWLEKNFLR
ncbi:MAG: extracellular solute-binding protein [Verrucomicrobiales bacterium]|nr:extracellular solute-binding protein [Verrucomicrobiales bacterium]